MKTIIAEARGVIGWNIFGVARWLMSLAHWISPRDFPTYAQTIDQQYEAGIRIGIRQGRREAMA
jgi:hypothetical protein